MKCIICGNETNNTIYAGSACHYAAVCKECEDKIKEIWNDKSIT
jgi:DNA-directed RNA polymerase subunit RPC12/RpoP